jgi:hypothetical protein
MEPLGPISTHMRDQIGPAAGKVAAIASRQHGVVAHSQLVAAGLTSSTIGRWTKAGHLHRLHRGVYAVGHRNLTRHGLWMAAVLAAGPGAALSHGAAAKHTGLDRSTRLGAIHLSVPRQVKRSPRGLIVHRPRSLEPVDLTRRFGIPVTTPTRTIHDLAPSLSPAELRRLFERSEYLDVLDRPRLNALLAGASGRCGLGTLRELLAYEPLPLAAVRSGLERIVLSACRTHSLPLPVVNVPVLDYEVDFLWPSARFVVEADGGQHRGERRERDNLRDVTLARVGYLVRRYTEAALADPGAVAAEIVAIVAERPATSASSPSA